jgi:hypothetical protein
MLERVWRGDKEDGRRHTAVTTGLMTCADADGPPATSSVAAGIAAVGDVADASSAGDVGTFVVPCAVTLGELAGGIVGPVSF